MEIAKDRIKEKEIHDELKALLPKKIREVCSVVEWKCKAIVVG